MRAYHGRYNINVPIDKIKILQAFTDLWSDPPVVVGLDAETISLKDNTIIGIGIATPLGDSFYFSWPNEIASIPWHLIGPSETRKVWHNAPYDLSRSALGRYGADIDNIEDSAIITRLLNIPTVLSIACHDVGVHTWSVKELFAQVPKAKTMLDLPPEWVAQKCCRDAMACLQIYLQKKQEVDQEYYAVERDMTSLLLHMSHRGILLDQELVSKLDQELQSSYELFYNTCKAQGFNPHSPEQVAWMLGNQNIFLPWDWKHGKKFPSTSKDVLETIDHPIAKMTLLARKYKHLWGIVHKLVGKERAYSNFHLDAITGRVASFTLAPDEIQQHNIPTGRRLGDIIPQAGPLRRIFMADSSDGFTIWDLAQGELRVLQHFTKDDKLLEALNMPGGGLHSFVQSKMNIYSRVMAKNLVFGGFVYGGSPEVVMKFTGLQDINKVAGMIKELKELFPITAAAIDKQREQGLRDMEIETLYGRKLRLDTHGSGTEKHIMNCAINYPIQGGQGEIFKRMMIKRWKSGQVSIEDMILQVHDEGLENGIHPIDPELEWLAGFYTPIEVKTQPTLRWQ